jgi:hypothetical protein
MSFVLPAGDWRREKGSPEEMQVIFSRVGAPGRDQTLSVSRVEYGVERYALSPAEHTALIFDMERDKRRPQGSWSGWNRSERVIGDRKYPVMTYQVAYPAGSPPKVIADAIFALYFPADFASREQFYVFNWIDTHLAGETAAGPAELDTILASFAAEPRKSAPQVVTYTIGIEGVHRFSCRIPRRGVSPDGHGYDDSRPDFGSTRLRTATETGRGIDRRHGGLWQGSRHLAHEQG